MTHKRLHTLVSAVDHSPGTAASFLGTNAAASALVERTIGNGLSVSDSSLAVALEAAGSGTGGLAFDVGEIRVDAGDGITLNANGVSVDTGSTLSFTGGVWTFTKDSLQITGTPDSGNDPVNKTYADGLALGLRWRTPVHVNGLVGNANETTLEGLTPSNGHAYVVTAANGDGTLNPGGVSIAAGDLVQYKSGAWFKIVTNSGGFPPNETRAILSTSQALISPYTDSTDDGKIAQFDGTSLTAVLTSESTDGAGVVVRGEDAYNENVQYVFDGTVPTGVWIQISGAGALVAGDGISISGSTVSVALEAAGTGTGGLAFDVGELRVDTGDGLKLTSNGVEVALEAAGTGTGGLTFDAGELRVDVGTGLQLDANGVSVVDRINTVKGSVTFAGSEPVYSELNAVATAVGDVVMAYKTGDSAYYYVRHSTSNGTMADFYGAQLT